MINTIITHRLRRLSGQLERLEHEIDAGTPCAKLVPQLLAVKGALDATIVAYIESSLAECAKNARPEELVALMKTMIKKL